MAKYWDESMRKLLRIDPQAFVDLVLPQAQYVKLRSEQLKAWNLEVDALVEVVVENEPMLTHYEFQTYNDPTMPERLLRYNVLARSEYNLPVLSCVIYLLKDGTVKQPPLSWDIPTRKNMLQFEYETIEMGELTPQDILKTGQAVLLPLLPLTKGGATREVVDTMFTRLAPIHSQDLEHAGFTLAFHTFTRLHSDNLEWLKERYRTMFDILRDEPVYREILREGRAEGELIALRETVLKIVKVRFPKLLELAQQQIEIDNDVQKLKKLRDGIIEAVDVREAEKSLLQEEQ